MTGLGLAAGVWVLGCAGLFAALLFFGAEVAADGQGEEEGDEAEEGDEDEGGDVHKRSAGGAQIVASQLEVEAAACEAEFARGARDVAFVLAQRLGDHAPFEFGHRVGQR